MLTNYPTRAACTRAIAAAALAAFLVVTTWTPRAQATVAPDEETSAWVGVSMYGGAVFTGLNAVLLLVVLGESLAYEEDQDLTKLAILTGVMGTLNILNGAALLLVDSEEEPTDLVGMVELGTGVTSGIVALFLPTGPSPQGAATFSPALLDDGGHLVPGAALTLTY